MTPKNFTRWLKQRGFKDDGGALQPNVYHMDALYLMQEAWTAGRDFERMLWKTGRKRKPTKTVEREDSEGEAMIERQLGRC